MHGMLGRFLCYIMENYVGFQHRDGLEGLSTDMAPIGNGNTDKLGVVFKLGLSCYST